MNLSVIIVAAGLGTRFKSKAPKALVLFKKKALIEYSLSVFQKMKAIQSIVIVGHKDHLKRFEGLHRDFGKVSAVVSGGATRSDSVKCGLAAVGEAEIVLVHDAARPLVDAGMVNRLLAALKTHKAAITAVPVKATIKQVNAKTMTVDRTLPRNLLWDVQTPQGFDRAVLVQAHAKKFTAQATDDAILVEHLGVPVKVVMGSYRNIKITTPEDLAIAEGLL